MTQADFVQVGEVIHCLVCHKDIQVDGFVDHSLGHGGLPISSCIEGCGEWYNKQNEI